MTPHERMVIEREKRRQQRLKESMLPKKQASALTYTMDTFDELMREIKEAG